MHHGSQQAAVLFLPFADIKKAVDIMVQFQQTTTEQLILTIQMFIVRSIKLLQITLDSLNIFYGIHDITRSIDHPFQFPGLGFFELDIEELCVKPDNLTVQKLHIRIKVGETVSPGHVFFKRRAVVKDQLVINAEGSKAIILTLLKEMQNLLAQRCRGYFRNLNWRIGEIDGEDLLAIREGPDEEAGEDPDKGCERGPEP